MIMWISSDILTESVPQTCLKGIALALIHHEFTPRFTNQFVLFLSPSCQTLASFVISDVIFFFVLTVSAEALRISGLHAPIVIKIAFMKLHMRRSVIFCIFSAHCLMPSFFYHNGRSSSAWFIIHNFICCCLLPLIFSLKLLETRVHERDLFRVQPKRQTGRQLGV